MTQKQWRCSSSPLVTICLDRWRWQNALLLVIFFERGAMLARLIFVHVKTKKRPWLQLVQVFIHCGLLRD